MALPSAYLTSTKNVSSIFEAIKKAQAPSRFTQKFLESLGFASTNDRLIINVLKSLKFLTDTGEPIARYHQYLDPSQSKRILAEGVREAYADLFQINKTANMMSRTDVKGKMKTLSQGQYSDSVIEKMAATFKTLCEQADFSATIATPPPAVNHEELPPPPPEDEDRPPPSGMVFSGLNYNIHLHLPESRDPAVYDALFRSLREHLP